MIFLSSVSDIFTSFWRQDSSSRVQYSGWAEPFKSSAVKLWMSVSYIQSHVPVNPFITICVTVAADAWSVLHLLTNLFDYTAWPLSFTQTFSAAF